MLTSKQRAKLRAAANTADTILQVGKGGVTAPLLQQVDEALTAHELIKLRVLETSPGGVKETASLLAEKTSSSVVQVIGGKIVLFRRNEEKPVYEL